MILKHSAPHLFHLKMLRDYLSAKALHPSLKQGKRVKINLRGFGVINIFYSDFSIFYYTCISQALFSGHCFTVTGREFPTEMLQLGILLFIFFRDTDDFRGFPTTQITFQ